MWLNIAPEEAFESVLNTLIPAALEEDLDGGDVTTKAIVPPEATANARIMARAPGVVAGLVIAERVFRHLNPRIQIVFHKNDGDTVAANEVLCSLSGDAQTLLSGERVALNFLQRLSGIATRTRQFVKAVAGTGAVILDTRKTTPGWRLLEKWAVRLGGGQNHRMGLYDMVLIKENHIAIAGSITRAVQAVRAAYGEQFAVEVEVRNLTELEEALALNVDRILLDNMGVPQLRQAVERVNGRVPLEASGGVTLETVRDIAETGVQFISVGELTHSAPALDISMLIDVQQEQ